MLIEMPDLPLSINERQRRFVEGVLRGNSPSKAAACAGYSERSARKQASRLLKRDDIIEIIQNATDIQKELINV
jgi:phage terminase small subunit